MASSVSNKGSWIVAAGVGAVEALKDQAGLCRWNYVLRSLHQHAKSNVSSATQAKRRLPVSSSSAVDRLRQGKRADEINAGQRSEESLRKVMYLSCWGPN